jgi:hypothetical protein
MKMGRRQAVVAAAKPGERGALFFANHQKGCVAAAFQGGKGQRDARFGFGADYGGDPTVALGKHSGVGK